MNINFPSLPKGVVVALLVLFSILSLGCNPHRTRTEHVTLRLKWLYNASTLGELWGIEKGIFKKYGIDLILKEGGAESDAISELELGRVQFGIASGDQVIRAASMGATPVVIAQIFQKNPLEWIYIKERVVIRSAPDLKGKTIGITFGGNDETIFKAIMKKFGIGPNDIRLYAVHYDYAPFWRGEADLWPCYRNTQGVFLAAKIKKRGETPEFLDPHSWGISFVANCLVTSKGFLEAHPDIVEKVRKAEIEAWEEALRPENLDNAIRILKKYEPNIDDAVLREQIRDTREMILDESGHVGRFDQMAWQQTLALMEREGLIENPVKLKDILHPIN